MDTLVCYTVYMYLFCFYTVLCVLINIAEHPPYANPGYTPCACSLLEFKGHRHGNLHPFIPVLSPSFLYHPYIPSFKSKDFSFSCLLSFCCTLHIKFYALRNILPGAIYCCLHTCLCLCRVVGSVLCMYANFHCYNC